MRYILDDIKCNVSGDHTAVEGKTITYACSLKYQGIMVDGLLRWHGKGVGLTHQYNGTPTVLASAKPGTCYTGESTVQR